jgi:hypothetical protein
LGVLVWCRALVYACFLYKHQTKIEKLRFLQRQNSPFFVCVCVRVWCSRATFVCGHYQEDQELGGHYRFQQAPLQISFLLSAGSTPYGCAYSIRGAQESPMLLLDCAGKSIPSVATVTERFSGLLRAQSRLSRARLCFSRAETKLLRIVGPPKRDACLEV